MDDRLRAVAAALVVSALGLIAGLVLVVAVLGGATAAGAAVPPFAVLVASLVLVQGVAFGGVAAGYLRYRGRSTAWLGIRRPSLREGGVVVLGYLLAIGAAMGGATLVALTGVEAGRNNVADVATGNPDVILLLVPASVLLIGPGEELLFRGVVQGRLRESFGPAAGVGLAAAIFAAIHVFALTGSSGARLVTVGILFGPSLVFGAAYEYTDNLVVPSLIHGVYNATLFALLYAALKLADSGVPVG